VSGLYELIEQHATGDPDETAAAVFDAMGLPTKWRDVFHRVVRDECRRRYRSAVRDMEHGHPFSETQEEAAEPMSRTAFLQSGFSIGGGRHVTWGEATVEDHLARIAYLETFRTGIARTIAKHEQAVADITAAGVRCLAELEAVAA
jgi:hypothetical protein